MASNLAINDDLLSDAQNISGIKTKKDTVNTALKEFVQRRKQLKVINLFNSIEYDKEYNYKDHR